MSVRSRINELIDEKNLQDAINTIEIRGAEITTADLHSVYYLLQKLLDAKQGNDVIRVLNSLEKSPVFLSSGDFSSIIKGLISIGTLEKAQLLILTFIDKKIIKDPQPALAFIECAIDQKEFDSALQVLDLLCRIKIPLNERSWESLISYFNKKDAIVHTAQLFNIMSEQAIKSKKIWQDFILACTKNKNTVLAISTLNEIAIALDMTTAAMLWNLLLEKVVEDTELPCFEICMILDKVIHLGVVISENTLVQSMIRLIIGEEQGKICGYLKNLKHSVNMFVMSRLISKCIDMNLPKEALELSNFLVLETFGPTVTIEKLEVSNEKLKWILKHQQMQMIKFMKMKKHFEDQALNTEMKDDIDEDDFIFL